MFDRLPKLFLNSRYGKPLYKVNIVALGCEKFEFPNNKSYGKTWRSKPQYPPLRCDVDMVIRFGRAFEMAKLFQERPWYMTEEGVIVCGDRLGDFTVEATLAVDDDYNLSFLAGYKKRSIREGDAFRAEVKNLHPRPDESPGVGLPLILLSDDV